LKKFEIVNLGENQYCLGIQINCVWQSIQNIKFIQTKASTLEVYWSNSKWLKVNQYNFMLWPIVNFWRIWVFKVMQTWKQCKLSCFQMLLEVSCVQWYA
jgi:hypothetical protein